MKPRPDAFSARENVHHLHDIEAEGYGVRLTRMLDETEPVLADLADDPLTATAQWSG